MTTSPARTDSTGAAETAAAPGVPRPFDLSADLGDGTTVLEASAGTGKTYAIVGIAARQIAEGIPIDKLLLVTFSRSATAELRDRMRARLAGLVRALDTDEPSGDDVLLRVLRTGGEAEIATRRDRLTRALSDFDASTIATTHTFCNRMLEALGFLGERELVHEIVEDVDDLVEEAALDLYLRGFARDAEEPAFGFGDAVTIAKESVRSPGAILAPAPGTGNGAADTVATRRVRFSAKVREIVERRKRVLRLRTYDDLQTILHGIVTDPTIGAEACARIRDAFDLVLVDEFQDTDPYQWEILRRCFHDVGTGPGTERTARRVRLVLVGDPKQSIYAFRGAEVLSYLQAVRVADHLLALDTNWRSDEELVKALFRVYGGANLGHADITVHEVKAGRTGSRLTGAPALRLRWFTHDDFPVRSGRGEFASIGPVRDRVIADVAADIAALLASDARLDSVDGPRPVHPGDIAILVSANKTIEPLQRALAGHGIGSVVGTGTSVFSTMSALHWLWLLRAVEQPSRADRVALAALTPLIGWTPAEVASAGDDRLTALAADLADLARVFTDGGFAAMAGQVLARGGVAARVLATDDGERTLTDLMQVSTVCNRHVVEQDCGLTSLQEWLADRIADVSRWRRSEEQTRRLDRDTHVVQIMTVHASKGLQFPIVYVPFGWDGSRYRQPPTFHYHDDEGRRHLDVGGQGSTGRGERLSRSISEDAGEDLRKFYVALTRAASQVVMWWAPSYGTAESSLHRLLFARQTVGFLPMGTDLPEKVPVPAPDECATRLQQFAAGTDTISVESAGGLTPPRRSAAETGSDEIELAAASFTGTIDRGWRRTSYSAIVADAGHGHAEPSAGSESESETVADEPVDHGGEPVDAVAGIDGRRPSPMNGMPFGAAFGTLVHEVLEYVDTAQPDRTAHIRELCVESAARYASPVDIDALTAALDGVLTTPLGFGDLWGIGPRDRLAELDFELPLGDGHGNGATLAAIAGHLDRLLPADDPLAGYADVLRTVPDQQLRGFLTGSIDSVLRTPDGRFVVVDYKTNRLHPGELAVDDFSTAAMAAEMIRSHYPLQALLYSVALHRYLRWRLPGYHPATHLGPVQYHFVRGMAGPDTPPGCGVFEWHVPAELVTTLSDLLAGGDR
ncbi:UvrD-helicase domain-containing protein [Gordonia desulfuricans]|uniref:RecBCD enzyme subunit RecB n=1 Tax=Gordonia desulfuricans TaxID=89051 RepID=A0A7K3LL94_9ACTN|nr:UvrD-helicase domain-containing protein [Gordonia desulfuricans]NDK89004.1 UvrD-helicase domain-containing protein [Gordonia desulfuricans]